MTFKVPIRTVYDNSNNAIGLSEFQSTETVGYEHGGTGLSVLGSANQILKVNSDGNAIEWAADAQSNLNPYLQVSNANITFVTKSTALSSNNALMGLINDRLQVANAAVIYATKATALSSNNSLKVLIDDRMQVANAIATFSTLTQLGNTNSYIASVQTNLNTTNANVDQKLGATASVTLNGDVTGSGSFSSNAVSITTDIAASGTPTGTFGSASKVPVITVGADGRITNISNTNVAGVTGFTYTPANNTFAITTADGGSFTSSIDELDNYALTSTVNATFETKSVALSANNAQNTLILDRLQVANATSLFVNVSGDTMSGALAMGTNKITGMGDPTAAQDAATKTYVDTAVANIVDTAPEALNTLNELAAALGDDSNFATTTATALGGKAANTYVNSTFQTIAAEQSNLGNTNSYIAGVQTNLDATNANVDQKLGATASVTLSGDVTGTASFSSNAVSITTTIADDSHNHVISNVDGLQNELDSKIEVANAIATFSTLTQLGNTNSYIAGVQSNLNATNANVDQKLGATASVTLSGAVTGSGSFSGNSISITTTATADPTITLGGDLTGSVTLTNLGNGTLTAAVVDDSHNHIISNVDGLQNELDSKIQVANVIATFSTLTQLGNTNSYIATKQATITGGATTITSSNLTASRALVSDGSGKVGVSAVTSTEIGYLDGVTSAIQTQLNSKQATITGAATTIDTENLTVSRALVSDGSGKVAVSAVTSTEIGYLDGVTSAIQTQLNAKGVGDITGVTAGSGLTGGGDAGSVTLNVGAGSYITVAADTVAVDATTTSTASKVVARDGSGDFAANIITAVDFNATSDQTMKTNVTTIESSLEKLDAIRGVNFNWKKDDRYAMGVIAQEVEEVIPEVVSIDGEGHRSVNYGALVGLLIEAVKDLKNEVDELKANK
jgi:hypothetical protein